MLGLIKKDFLLIKANLKTLLIFLVIYTLISFNGNFEMSFLLPFLCIMTFVSTFSYDDFYNWNAYAITLPSGRKSVVRSKYIATILLSLVASVIGIAISIMVAMTKGNVDIESIVGSLIGCLLAIALIVSIMYPLIFKYGSEKGRIILFIGVFGIAIIGSLILKYVDFSILGKYLAIFKNWWFIIIPIFIIVILVISYLISERIYLKKEF